GAPRLWLAGAELGAGRHPVAPRCSLNVVTGPHRRADLVQADLARVRRVSREHGATVNDLMLVVITGALRTLLRNRGEHVAEIVVSVPITERATTTAADLGNRTGVMPVRVPTLGSAEARLEQTAALTRAQKNEVRGASQALVGPSFRLAAALGVFRPMINRQRLVNTFLTNLNGPPNPLTIGGIPIRRIVPVTVTAGNVSVAFAVLSYAGTLSMTVIRDPDLTPDSDVLMSALGAELVSLGLG
ncbi:MAG: WS/DGAT domain-containing protein, partial [Propionicimonas sp.]